MSAKAGLFSANVSLAFVVMPEEGSTPAWAACGILAPMSETKSLTRDVKDVLLDWIRQGKYPSGSQLPSVQDLVARLDVSRTVVREAMQSLVGMGFVEFRPGIGCFVKTIPPELIVNADVMAALIDLNTLIEVARARKIIEAAVARQATIEATEEDFEEIESVLGKIERMAKKNQPMYSITPEFHVAVARAAHNEVLVKVIASFNSLMAAAGELIERNAVGYAYRVAEYESHRDLYRVIRKRDPQLTHFEMEAHVQQTVDILLEIQSRPAQ
jgi:GntR family transcriptional repressor for pyruvate dehydrogenase complex